MEQETQTMNGKTGMSKKAKVLVGTLFIFAILALGYLSIGIWGKDWLRMWNAYEARKFDAAVQSELDRLADMEKADTYGGASPEETAKLILAALEQGDIDLASKYYYVLDQEKALEKYRKLLNDRQISKSIDYYRELLSRGVTNCGSDKITCGISYLGKTTQDEYVKFPGNPDPFFVPAGTEREYSVNFSLNQYTGLWKARN